MVKRQNALYRAAFTMIELIFAIVVVSVVVLTLPIMIQMVSKGVEDNIVQEAIFAASTELMESTSYYWDANSMQDNNLSNLERVININNVCEDNASNPRYGLALGHIAQPYHRRCLENSAIAPADSNSALFPNLDNAEHADQLMFTDNTTDAVGYKEDYHSTVDVTRTNDVKVITITIRPSGGGDIITRLRTYSANIGEVDFYKRRL
ncbi:MAG: hypothetical protein AB7D34_02735 [Sulfurimonas sp.]